MAMVPERFCQRALRVSHRQVDARLVSPVDLVAMLGLVAGPFVFLDSAGGEPRLCRYSFLAWDPRLRVKVKAGRATLIGDAHTYELEASDPFDLLRKLVAVLAPAQKQVISTTSTDRNAELSDLPLWGGAFGQVSYDAGRYIERLPRLAVDDLGLPEIDFIFPRRLVCFDHARSEAHIFFDDADPAELATACDAVCSQQEVSSPGPILDVGRHAFSLSSVTRSNMTGLGFQQIVRRAKEYIYAGDIFQSNLSQRLELDFDGSSLDLYESLRMVNPSPFAALLEMGDYQIISSSPERLVKLDGRRAQTRPIAGTRRRGVNFLEDGDLMHELNLDPKERAEHIMLVDLERNDMGRVCDYGSVHVDELMVNEAYSHVIHIVSNVAGTLHSKKDALDLLKAMFPGGTITGCPKVRCMQIIDELEPVRRGPYTGSLGYIGYNGNMDMNIIIRTLVRLGKKVYAQAGAGIVADSDPEREYRETLRKSEAMVLAVERAKKQRSRFPISVHGFDLGSSETL